MTENHLKVGSVLAGSWYPTFMTSLHVLRDTATGVLVFFFVTMLFAEACAKVVQ